ncbi:hypothetical protein BJ138DRAFT_1104145 [Hygrophoropsis aurantiaca]|uniref:Uncharacterized protein n=1 Tax=Hygrophoropsis aurantiaca TaxID=72124 RepID=A0ACB8A300_9AGAM|nr:hypothetical protein BJ138DRAFT_1104145 [Hygrophoropsis aurantiaca]
MIAFVVFACFTLVNGFCRYANYDEGISVENATDRFVVREDPAALMKLDFGDPKNAAKLSRCRCRPLPKAVAGKVGSLVFEPGRAEEWPVEATLWSGDFCFTNFALQAPVAKELGTLKAREIKERLSGAMRGTKSVMICGRPESENWKKLEEKERKATAKAREASAKEWHDAQRKKEEAARAKKHPPAKTWWEKVKGVAGGAVKGAIEGAKNTVHGHHVTKTEVADMGALAVAGGVAAELAPAVVGAVVAL